MANIRDIVEQIRHAVFGKDVRENIAQGIETCYSEEVYKNEQLNNKKLDKPAQPGSQGMLLCNNGNGSTSWTNYAMPSDEQVGNAINSWLDDHPEATTTVEDGAITEQKLADSLKATSFPPMNLDYRTAVQKDVWNNGALVNYTIQSMCYDSNRDRYVVGFSHRTNDNESLLMAFKKLDFSLDPATNVLLSVTKNYGHCNDMSYYYDPVSGNDYVYIVTGGNTIYKIKASDFTQVDYYNPGLSNIWEISVYRDGTIFIGTNGVSRRYSSDFSQYTTISGNDLQTIKDYFGFTEENSYMVSQGTFIYNDQPYILYNNMDPNKPGWYHVYIARFDSNGLAFVRKVATDYEVEAADVVGNKLEFICGQEWMTSAEAYLGVPDISGAPVKRIPIQDGSDLNDFKTPGIYFSANRATSETLLNIPEYAQYVGFTMEVIRSGYDNIRQIMYTNGFWDFGSVCVRGYAVSPKRWGPWYALPGINSDIDSNKLVNYEMFGTYGFITTGGTELMLILPYKTAHDYDDISITKLTISLRIPGGGYVIGNGTNITEYITGSNLTFINRFTQGLLYFCIKKDDGWGVPNNVPVIGSCNITCTFSYSS